MWRMGVRHSTIDSKVGVIGKEWDNADVGGIVMRGGKIGGKVVRSDP